MDSTPSHLTALEQKPAPYFFDLPGCIALLASRIVERLTRFKDETILGVVMALSYRQVLPPLLSILACLIATDALLT